MSRRIRISVAGIDALRVLASRGALPRHPSGSGWGMGLPDGGPLARLIHEDGGSWVASVA
jgi:hypothetical protein